MFDVIIFGSATLDIFLNTEAEKRKNLICYPSGSKLLVKDIKFFTGGGGTNTAVAFSRLGLKTAFLGILGSDEAASKILNELKKEKISFVGIKTKESTAHSIILDSHLHVDRTILVYKGLNNKIKFRNVNLRKLKTKWFYFSTMLNESFKTQKKLVKYAEKNNIKIAYNISPYLAKKGLNYIKPILKKTKFFILNKEEATLLTKKDNIDDIFKKLHKNGPKIICITDGKKDIYACDSNYIYILKPNKIKTKERTGAGDAFASSLVASLIKKKSLDYAMQIALVNSESVIRNIGAKNKLLSWKEASEHVKKHPGKIKKRELC